MASLYASIASGHFFSSAILSASSTRPAARLVDFFCGAPPCFWACELSGAGPNRRADTIRRRIDFEWGNAIFITQLQISSNHVGLSLNETRGENPMTLGLWRID